MKRVYVAGPITKGDQFANVRAGIEAGDQLLNLGYAPYIPHLNYSWHMMFPHANEVWYRLDFEWLAMCDALVRLPGESPGANAEVQFAMDRGIPVFFGVTALVQEWGVSARAARARALHGVPA